MMQACSARTIPGVWCNSLTGRIRLLLGMLLACHAALFAQNGTARLTHGIEKFEGKKYTEAIGDLKAVQPQLPKLADYIAYYLAASDTELKDFAQVHKD